MHCKRHHELGEHEFFISYRVDSDKDVALLLAYLFSRNYIGKKIEKFNIDEFKDTSCPLHGSKMKNE